MKLIRGINSIYLSIILIPLLMCIVLLNSAAINLSEAKINLVIDNFVKNAVDEKIEGELAEKGILETYYSLVERCQNLSSIPLPNQQFPNEEIPNEIIIDCSKIKTLAPSEVIEDVKMKITDAILQKIPKDKIAQSLTIIKIVYFVLLLTALSLVIIILFNSKYLTPLFLGIALVLASLPLLFIRKIYDNGFLKVKDMVVNQFGELQSINILKEFSDAFVGQIIFDFSIMLFGGVFLTIVGVILLIFTSKRNKKEKE